jgi:hypothetical protein
MFDGGCPTSIGFLRGADLAELPVQAPTAFELVMTRKLRGDWAFGCRRPYSPVPTK